MKIIIEQLTTKLTLIIIGLTAGSGLLIPATYASFHPVTTGEIADDTIRSADISNTAGVQSVDIVNGQVGSVDIGTGQVASVDIQDNTITSADLGNVITRVQGSGININPSETEFAFVDCPSGQLVTGGGFTTSNVNLRVTTSHPHDANTWVAEGVNQGTSEATLVGYALCV
jgi:hypothetical protein